MHGTPVPMGLVIAGRNSVSVDAVGASVMGFDPFELEQLALASQMGVGEPDIWKMLLRGSSMSDVQRPFRRR